MGVLEHEMQRKILLRLIHSPTLSFNDLWAKDGESNAFAYHLNKLESLNLVAKSQHGLYELTDEGRKLSAFIEGDTGKQAEFPTLTVVMLVRKGNLYLCQKRLKEPFFGIWSLVSGKINFGLNVFECAQRDLLEETGLTAAGWTLKAVEQTKTFEGSKLLFHHYMFIVETEKTEGNLKEKTHKAEHAWLTLEQYRNSERFPSDWFFEHIIPAQKPIMIEAERYMENGKFVGSKTVNILEF